MIWIIGASAILRASRLARAEKAPALSDAVGALERQRSGAEQYAVILATVGRKDVDTYTRGIQLYADAKEEFDGLIAALRIGLIEGRNPVGSPTFAAAMDAAAEKRNAFTTFVDQQVIEKAPGARGGLIDVGTVPDLVKAITDSGLAIWDAFRTSSKERREAILTELDHLRWRNFADLAPKQDG